MAIALAGCSGATAKKDGSGTAGPPELIGTWELMIPPDDDGEHRHRVLTFRADRWVSAITERDDTGAIIREDHGSGGWERTDTYLTKIYLDDEADNAPVSLAKTYTLTADTLTVQEWYNNAPDAQMTTMTRVTDAAILTGTLAGSSWVMTDLQDSGVLWRWTLAFTDAGWRYTFDADPDEPGESFSMGGATWTTDNGAILAVPDAVSREDLQWWVGETLRFSYAPSGEADRLRVSLWFNDQRVNVGVGWTLDPHPVWQYGNYGWSFTRADP